MIVHIVMRLGERVKVYLRERIGCNGWCGTVGIEDGGARKWWGGVVRFRILGSAGEESGGGCRWRMIWEGAILERECVDGT